MLLDFSQKPKSCRNGFATLFEASVQSTVKTYSNESEKPISVTNASVDMMGKLAIN